jgi:hypothetical protein
MKTKTTVTFIALTLFALSNLFAQTAVFTYQGRVTDNGTNFTGLGQFEFALVTSLNANQTATATANAPSGGYITGYAVVTGGSGYVTAPAVTVFGGGGSGATATAHISGGAVTSITVNNTGNGLYTSTPTVIIDPPPPNISYTTYWSNDGMSVNGSEPSAAITVAVTNGLFTVVLGDATIPNMAAISASLFNQPNLQLRIWFNDSIHGFAALSPVQNLTPTPYAVIAASANSLNSIGNTNGGLGNFFVGSAGNATTSGSQNTGSGLNVLLSNTSGSDNTANGFSALYSNTTGGGNTVNGWEALYSNTSGSDNTANGWEALYSNTTGYVNTANGEQALYSNTTGIANTADGFFALHYNTSGEYNIALGFSAGSSITTGSHNIDIGNSGDSDDDSIIRIGTSQTATYLAGTVYASDVGIGTGSPANQLSVAGNADFSGSVGIGTASPSAQFDVRGDKSSSPFPFSAPLVYFQNSDTGANSSPALRLVGYGNTISGVLSISAQGTGLIAQFGNANGFVADIRTNGTIDALVLNPTSDRNAKENFSSVNAKTMLEKVALLPISEWNYKVAGGIRHIGPMAQDFQAAFHVGEDDKHIATVDADGVALAAIQGLNQKVEEQKSELKARDADIQQLKQSVAELQQLISQSAQIKSK